MGLPWVRLDANFATHDKVLDLLAKPNGCKAFVLYVCALGYSGGHATDGHVPSYALPVNHGNERLARLLVDTKLWEYDPRGGYQIRNFAERQEIAAISEAKRIAGHKAACVRWHGKDCGCWKTKHGDP
jgi:hypothetical protein